MTCFIELLTVRTWLWSVLPRLLWRRLRRGPLVACYVIDGTTAGWALARASHWLTGVTPQPLRFRMMDLRDEQGLLLRLRIAYRDLGQVQQAILAEPGFQQAVRGPLAEGRLPDYLTKALAVISLTERQTIWRALYTIHVCARHQRAGGVYFMERRVWWPVLYRYAAEARLTLIPLPPAVNLRAWRRRLLSPQLKRVLYRLQVLGWLGGRRVPRSQWVTVAGARRAVEGPKLAVEYYGHLNLDRPECYSDLFFCGPSGMSGSDIVMTFNHETHPLDALKLEELRRHGVEAVAVRPKVAADPAARTFVPRLWPRRADRIVPRVAVGGMEGRWLGAHARTYIREERAFWSELCEAAGIRVSTSWFKYTETHAAIADALARTGGVSTIYQRAYDAHPSAEIAIMADIAFVFAHESVRLERSSGSHLRYAVVTGYFGDFRFPLLRAVAGTIRARLQAHGARRIVAFADENFHVDERWHTGPAIEWETYQFLLEQVVSQPWLGLVLKPKTPATLRRRLGPLAELLKRAEATGRCFFFEEGPIQGSYPPAAAALAADLMIHGHLNAATAGLDAALAGVPTLLLDRMGWSISPLYQLGVGRVVFTEWDVLWKTCLEHWRRPGGIPGFGDWSQMLERFDSFRDGRAAERMGTYLRWLLEGFRGGLARETVMADAAQRYAACWGKDQVIEMDRTTVNAMPTGHAGPSIPAEAVVPASV